MNKQNLRQRKTPSRFPLKAHKTKSEVTARIPWWSVPEDAVNTFLLRNPALQKSPAQTSHGAFFRHGRTVTIRKSGA